MESLASHIQEALPTNTSQYHRLLIGLESLPEQTRRARLRNLCIIDLYFLLRYMLGRKDTEREWYLQRCREVQANPDGYLDLWAREHGKSSVITFAKTIQDILTDPEITVGIFSHTRPIAKGFLRQIKREFEANEMLKTLFPDILWENVKEAPKWSEDDGIIVKRKGNPKESTVEAWGLVDGQPTSKHFRLRVYDDVVTRESVTTPEQIKKTTEAWELSDNLGVEGGKIRTIGTRYHLADSYSTMLERKAVIPRIYPATHNGRMDGNPVFFSPTEWERRKRTQSRSMIAAQLLQNPLADEDATFRPEWLRPYEVRPRTMNIGIMCDPSKGRSATSDNTAIAVIGIGSTGAKYLLDGYCHRMSLSQRWVALKTLYRLWAATPGVQNVKVGYERYGAQSDDEYFREQMEREKEFFTIEELNWPREGGNSKRDRVERLEPDFRNSRFYLPLPAWNNGPQTWRVNTDAESNGFGTIEWNEVQGFTAKQRQAIDAGSADLVAKAIKRIDEEHKPYDLTVRFIEEYMTFPFGQHDDLVDACSRFYDLDIKPPSVLERQNTEPNIYWDS